MLDRQPDSLASRVSVVRMLRKYFTKERPLVFAICDYISESSTPVNANIDHKYQSKIIKASLTDNEIPYMDLRFASEGSEEVLLKRKSKTFKKQANQQLSEEQCNIIWQQMLSFLQNRSWQRPSKSPKRFLPELIYGHTNNSPQNFSSPFSLVYESQKMRYENCRKKNLLQEQTYCSSTRSAKFPQDFHKSFRYSLANNPSSFRRSKGLLVQLADSKVNMFQHTIDPQLHVATPRSTKLKPIKFNELSSSVSMVSERPSYYSKRNVQNVMSLRGQVRAKRERLHQEQVQQIMGEGRRLKMKGG